MSVAEPAAAPTEVPLRRRVPAEVVGLAGLLTVSVLFRLPILINADAINSDAAVTALQARHLLQGEWSWFLWGAGYQSSVDPLMVAIGFFLFGDSARTAMAVPLVGHLIVVALAYAVLRRRLGAVLGAVAALPLVFTPVAINLIIQYGARQWCIVLVFLSLFLADRASRRRRAGLAFALSGFFLALSLYVDLYALQFVPAFGVLALLCGLDGSTGVRSGLRGALVRVSLWLGGAIAGLIPIFILRSVVQASGSQASIVFHRIGANFSLLWETCLPFLLGYKVWAPGRSLYADLWSPPGWFHAIQVLGALCFAVLLLSGFVLFLSRGLPWEARRLGVFGALAALTSFCAFMFSPLPSDQWSSRYLAPIVWMAPFAFVPIALRLGPRRFAAAVAPYLVSAAVGGWVSYGLGVRGAWPVVEPRADLRGEMRVQQFLQERGIHHAAAQYWLAYRLTFLLREDPIVVPFSPGEDRHPPFRRKFEAASQVAYIFHPSEPRAQPGPIEQQLRMRRADYERHEIEGFTVLIHRRR